eukprot:6158252-Prymnesium_polylepis.1
MALSMRANVRSGGASVSLVWLGGTPCGGPGTPGVRPLAARGGALRGVGGRRGAHRHRRDGEGMRVGSVTAGGHVEEMQVVELVPTLPFFVVDGRVRRDHHAVATNDLLEPLRAGDARRVDGHDLLRVFVLEKQESARHDARHDVDGVAAQALAGRNGVDQVLLDGARDGAG